MKTLSWILCGAVGLAAIAAAAEPPTEWVDPDTGHRVIRLSREPETAGLYFHQNAFTREGDKMVMMAPDGLQVYDWTTHEIKLVAPGVDYSVRGSQGIEVGRRTRNVYYEKEGTVYATNLDSLETRRIATMPAGTTMSAINADETLILGIYTEGGAPTPGSVGWPTANTPTNGPDGRDLTFAEQREVLLDIRLRQQIPMALFTVEIATGKVNFFHRSTDWLGHAQFSPTDPHLVMFCHEGPWHKVDRLWTVRTDGSDLTKLHTRTMNMEIAGHEFFGFDGSTIWYDLQTPRGEDFWVAGYEIASRQRTWYHLQRNEWSVHFNVSNDGSLFVGDGGDSEMVAHAPDGKWIYLFRPQRIPDVAGITNPHAGDLINPGFLQSERLVNMANHDYRLEPNVHLTPDNKWVVFRSNMHGPMHVYAVAVEK